MAYVRGNPKSKAELKRWLSEGRVPEVYQPGFGNVPHDGEIDLEGPHYPKPHTWYGTGTMAGGKLVKIK